MQQVECLLEWIQVLLSRDRAENIFEQTSSYDTHRAKCTSPEKQQF